MFPEYVFLAIVDEYDSYETTVYATFEGATHHTFAGYGVKDHEHKFRQVVDDSALYACRAFESSPCSAMIEKSKVNP